MLIINALGCVVINSIQIRDTVMDDVMIRISNNIISNESREIMKVRKNRYIFISRKETVDIDMGTETWFKK